MSVHLPFLYPNFLAYISIFPVLLSTSSVTAALMHTVCYKKNVEDESTINMRLYQIVVNHRRHPPPGLVNYHLNSLVIPLRYGGCLMINVPLKVCSTMVKLTLHPFNLHYMSPHTNIKHLPLTRIYN